MTREVVRVRGSFVGLIDDPMALVSVPGLQGEHVPEPRAAANGLANPSKLPRRIARARINDLLSRG
jgi:hypothetical protein